MEPISLITMMALGLGLGLVHAFDADHIMAVSTLASRRPSWHHAGLYGLRWALGHGGILLLLGVLLGAAGVRLPPWMQTLSEWLVGVVLVLLGVWTLWQLFRHRIRFGIHRHPGLVHAHFHQAEHTASDDEGGDHAPVFVGMLHGTAGSAPVFALVPALAQGELALGLVYLLVFSVGVAAGMSIFGMGLGGIQHVLKERGELWLNASRGALGVASMAFGAFWLAHV